MSSSFDIQTCYGRCWTLWLLYRFQDVSDFIELSRIYFEIPIMKKPYLALTVECCQFIYMG
jgi:hypothetical protein